MAEIEIWDFLKKSLYRKHGNVSILQIKIMKTSSIDYKTVEEIRRKH